VPHPGHVWHDDGMDATVVLGRQGRLVIPVDIRKELGLEPGDRLHLSANGSALTIERPADALTELRRFAAAVPKGRSFVDELLAERRIAAADE